MLDAIAPFVASVGIDTAYELIEEVARSTSRYPLARCRKHPIGTLRSSSCA